MCIRDSLYIGHLLTAAGEDQKWRHVMNGVGSSPSRHLTSGMDAATSAAALWTPADSPPTPIGSPRSAPGSDAPLNLTVSRTTRRLPSPPCPSPDVRAALGSVPRRQIEDSPVGSPLPAHSPYTLTKSDHQAARKSAILNNEVYISLQSICQTLLQRFRVDCMFFRLDLFPSTTRS